MKNKFTKHVTPQTDERRLIKMKRKLIAITLALTFLLLAATISSAINLNQKVELKADASVGGGSGSSNSANAPNASGSARGGAGGGASASLPPSGSGGGSSSSSSSSSGGRSSEKSGGSTKPAPLGGGQYIPAGNMEIITDPQKIVSDNEKETIRVIIRDFHKEGAYGYSLDFSSNNGEVTGTFSQNQINVSAGQKAEVGLTVYRNNAKLPIVFEVSAKSPQGDYSQTKVLWLTTSKPTTMINPPTETVAVKFFEGKGFVTSKTMQGLGSIIFLNLLLKENSLTGNIKLENGEVFKVTGELNGDSIKLSGESPKSRNKISVLGSVDQYRTFSVLKGDLEYSEGDIIESYDLTALSEKEQYFKEVYLKDDGEQKVVESKEKEVVTVDASATSTTSVSTSEKKEQYQVFTEEVKTKKFLWVIPTGTEEAVVKIINPEGKIYEAKLESNEQITIDKIKVTVGQVEKGRSIEYSIEKISS